MLHHRVPQKMNSQPRIFSPQFCNILRNWQKFPKNQKKYLNLIQKKKKKNSPNFTISRNWQNVPNFLEKVVEFNLEEKEKNNPQFCNIEKLAKFSKTLEKVVEFDLEEKAKFSPNFAILRNWQKFPKNQKKQLNLIQKKKKNSQLLCLSKKNKIYISFWWEKH